MDQSPAILIADKPVPRSRPAPRLRLVMDLEPRHRVFFGNLADLLWSRRVPPIRITSRPAPFWNDVFVPSGAPWTAFLESLIWHGLLLLLFIWGQSRVWEPVKLFPQREAFHRPITYFPPAPTRTFRAAESRVSKIRPQPRVTHAPIQKPKPQAPMPVTAEHKPSQPSLVTPPDIKQATALPNLPSSHAVTPMVPLSATAASRRNPLAEPSAVVAPPPDVGQNVDQATARRLALPQASAVAPAPELGSSAGRAVKAPNTGGLRVVPPAPSVQNAGNSTRAVSSLSNAGPNVVPPPPSVHGAGNARLDSMTSSGSQVVPPPPSVQNAGNSSRAGRLTSGLNSLPGDRPNVVPPPPSVPGRGNAAGSTRSIAGAGSEIVPPPPSVQAGGTAGSTRLRSLSGAGSEVVSPPPSVEGAGNSGRGGRLASLSGDDSPVGPPPRPAAAAGSYSIGNSSTGKILEPMDPLPTGSASDATGANANDDGKSTFEELPLGLLGVVFAPPGSSFFSNFEVFVAKRRVGKDKGQMQLIKLVYEFLPYQRRLSEYNLNNMPARVIKLKVTPDPSCDETLGQMLVPQNDVSAPPPEPSKLPDALRATDPNAVLPCYRTTATDFQKAMSRGQ